MLVIRRPVARYHHILQNITRRHVSMQECKAALDTRNIALVAHIGMQI